MKGVTKAGSARRRAKPLTRQAFLAIRNSIKIYEDGPGYNAKTIANLAGVSPETVRAVKRAKSWPAFVETKKQVRATRKAKETAEPPKTIWLAPNLDVVNKERDEARSRLMTYLVISVAIGVWVGIALYVFGVGR